MREAVVNAVVHNDYANGACPKFEFFSDRLEITSAGGLPYGVSEEDFFNGYSSPRNKEIMRVFRDLEIVEQLGSGVPRILERYERDVFEIRPKFLRVIFRYEQPRSETSGEKRGKKLSVNRRKVVDAMREDPYVTHVRLVELVGIGPTSIEKNIKFLKENGWIRRIGSAKGGHWEVLDE